MCDLLGLSCWQDDVSGGILGFRVNKVVLLAVLRKPGLRFYEKKGWEVRSEFEV